MTDSPQTDRRVLKVYSEFGRAMQESVATVASKTSPARESPLAGEGTPVAGRVAEAKRLFEAKFLDAGVEDSASISSSDLSSEVSTSQTSETGPAQKQASPNTTIWGRLKNAAAQNKYVSGAVSKLTEAAEVQRALACERAASAAAQRDAALQQRDEALCLLHAMQRERDEAVQLVEILRRRNDESRVLHVCAGKFSSWSPHPQQPTSKYMTARNPVAGGFLLAMLASGSGEHKRKAAAAIAALVLLGRNAALSCFAAGIAVTVLDRLRGGGLVLKC